ncbi:hypothetical protein [Periweissella ghanensis]|uniref:ABC transporter permease n=2 Tax=Periweissella ghanensis TaxID=467997 RepID=A0ABN8BJG2_9LACO|nr:hypothetical protein [Periweissella ghanensis]CAH0417748.1 hypothetical protein WGH24286_00160 [Periweissella ghanensis]
MRIFGKLIYRNWLLYWQNVKYRYLCLSLFYFSMLLIQRFNGQTFSQVFYGVIQLDNNFSLPIIWLGLSFVPIMIIGNAVTELVIQQYIYVAKIKLWHYLASIGIVLVISNLGLVIGTYIIFWHKLGNLNFFIIYWIMNILIACLYGLISVIVTPIITLMGAMAVYILGIAINTFPLISQLMASRIDYHFTWTETATLSGLLILSGFISNHIKKMDFMV